MLTKEQGIALHTTTKKFARESKVGVKGWKNRDTAPPGAASRPPAAIVPADQRVRRLYLAP